MSEILNKIFERESEGMTALEVYEETQRRFRYDLNMRQKDSIGGWTRDDMLTGRREPWKRTKTGDFTTCWFSGVPVTLGATCGC